MRREGIDSLLNLRLWKIGFVTFEQTIYCKKKIVKTMHRLNNTHNTSLKNRQHGNGFV